MDRSRIRGSAVLVATALAAAGCSSPSDPVLSIETYPLGASVSLLLDGHTAGQTPLEKVRVAAPAGKTEVLVIEMANYQTVAYPVGKESPDHLFFSLQKAPDVVQLQNAVNELQSDVRTLLETVQQLRDAEKKGGN